MRKKKLTAGEKGMKVNEQRFAMIVVLCNVLDAEKGVSNAVKSAIAASLLNMIDISFIPGDDDGLANLINNSIDGFCKQIEEEKGIEDYRNRLMESIKTARTVIDEIKAKVERIKDGEDILKNICLN